MPDAALLPVQAGFDPEIEPVFRAQQVRAIALRESTAEQRIEKIRALTCALRRHAGVIRDAAAADFGKTDGEVAFTEIWPTLQEAHEAIRRVRRWMTPLRVWSGMTLLGTQGWVQHEPRGVCLIIAPWNYPVNLSFGPLISALAAGNTAILKPSELAPECSRVIAEIVRKTFDPADVAVFEGDEQVAKALLALPFDHVFFTGSPAVGRHVMRAAAEHLTSVTLELGGKSPAIVDETADLEQAARTLVWAKFTNNGQTCIAPDYVLVHDSVHDAFVRAMADRIRAIFGETAAEQMRSPYYCRIVNDRHFQRLNALLDDARSHGAHIVGGDCDPRMRFIAPTLLERVPADARIQQEEIFGPLLPVLSYRELDQAIGHINAQPKPLALYVWSRNDGAIQSVLKRTSAGGTCVNHAVIQFMHPNLPFGGVGASGIGSAHGFYGFRAFSHERAVIRNRFSFLHRIFPPYTGRVLAMIRRLLGGH